MTSTVQAEDPVATGAADRAALEAVRALQTQDQDYLLNVTYDGPGVFYVGTGVGSFISGCEIAGSELNVRIDHGEFHGNDLLECEAYLEFCATGVAKSDLTRCAIAGQWDHTTITTTEFYDCKFANLTISDCDLTQATFRNCTFTNTTATNTTWPNGFNPADHGITIT